MKKSLDSQRHESVSATAERLEGRLAESKNARLPSGADHQASQFPEATVKTVRQILEARRQRGNYFRHDLFGEPAWDMLLELFAAELEQHRVSVSSVCVGSVVPTTTAFRWLKKLEQSGFLVRESDPCDARRQWVQLTPRASAAMQRYLAAFATKSVPV